MTESSIAAKTNRRNGETSRLLILGASVRAAAFSACRARWRPVCGDLFADHDLHAAADVVPVEDYPAGLLDVANSVPPSRWIYTGALENHPKLVGRISQRHHLLGNPPAVLAKVRDPFRVHTVLRSAGLAALAVRRCDEPPERNGNWLFKPCRGSGGRGIVVWDDETEPPRREPYFFQERVNGTPVSAVFVAGRLSCRLAGITRQLVGEKELHALPFGYCGSVGPLVLPAELTRQIERTGVVLATEFDLRGLFGVDFVIRRDVAFPVEVNPRYTASVEVLEYASGRSLLQAHDRACRSFDEPGAAAEREAELAEVFRTEQRSGERPIIGKAVLFAARKLVVSLPAPDVTAALSARPSPPRMADVPQDGTVVRPGQPVCTVYFSAKTVVQCLNGLFQRSRTVSDRLAAR